MELTFRGREKKRKNLTSFCFILFLFCCAQHPALSAETTACNFPFHVCPFRILGWDTQPFYSSRAAYDEGTVSFDFSVLECKRADPARIRLDPKLLRKNAKAVQRRKREIRGPDCFGFPLPYSQADYAAAGTHTCPLDSCLRLCAVLVLSALGGCYLTLGPRKLHWLLCQESMVFGW